MRVFAFPYQTMAISLNKLWNTANADHSIKCELRIEALKRRKKIRAIRRMIRIKSAIN